MTNNAATTSLGVRQPVPSDDLLLRETNHRNSNDLQLIVSLLGLESRRAATPEGRQVLTEAMERVAILARARRAMSHERPHTLGAALRQVCEALHAQAEPRSIVISLETSTEANSLSAIQITTLALVVNELATNAIKHAFEEGTSGHIRLSISRNAARDVIVIVDDDGLSFPELTGRGDGLGLGLVKRLMASIGGLLILPPSGTKTFELRVPVQGD